jgi:hypothetical protein
VGQGITNPYGQTKYFIEKFLEVRLLFCFVLLLEAGLGWWCGGEAEAGTCLRVWGCERVSTTTSNDLQQAIDQLSLPPPPPPPPHTKFKIKQDFQRSPEGKGWKVVVLRYFNPVGSHERWVLVGKGRWLCVCVCTWTCVDVDACVDVCVCIYVYERDGRQSKSSTARFDHQITDTSFLRCTALYCAQHDNSGRIGEDPSGIPNNLMPYVSQVRPVPCCLPFQFITRTSPLHHPHLRTPPPTDPDPCPSPNP